MQHHNNVGSAAPLLWMIGMMMAICVAMPLVLFALAAAGASAALLVVAAVALMGFCVFGHRFMRH